MNSRLFGIVLVAYLLSFTGYCIYSVWTDTGLAPFLERLQWSLFDSESRRTTVVLMMLIFLLPVSPFLRRNALVQRFLGTWQGKPAWKPTKLTAEQRFALATNALLTELNGHRHDCLTGAEPGSKIEVRQKNSLVQDWSVETRAQCLERLQWLIEEGHRGGYEERLASVESRPVRPSPSGEGGESTIRDSIVRTYGKRHPSILAWDLCRVVTVARFSVGAGYLSEDEAWVWILKAADILKTSFGSWRSMGENYCIGRMYWAANEKDELREVLERLLDPARPTSPWNQIPWPRPELAREEPLSG